MSKIVKRFQKMMYVCMGMSAIDIIIGILFIACTSFATKVNAVILGAMILIHGIFYIIKYIYDGLGIKIFAVNLITGVAAIILGLFTMFNPFDTLSFIGILFALWLIIVACEKLYFAYNLRKKQDEIFPLITFIGILMIVMGLLTALNPFKTFMLITRLIGIFLICSGLFDMMSFMLFRKRAKVLLEIFK